MVTMPERPDTKAAVAARLRRIRLALGLTQAAMAEKIGLESQQAWGNLERGINSLDPRIAVNIASKTRIPLDYIYRGLDDMVPAMFHSALTSPLEPHPTSRRGRKAAANNH